MRHVGFQHRAAFGGGWESAGRIAPRFFSSFLARFPFRDHCPTVLAGDAVTPFGLPTVLRFARFRARDISLSVIGLQVRRETAQIAKGWPSFRASLSRARSCGHLRQSTKCAWSLDQSPKAKRRRRATLGRRHTVAVPTSRTPALPRAYSLQPAVARLSVLHAAIYQGPKCALSTVTDSAGYPPDDSQPAGAARRGARPRKMVTARMAKFDRFLLFSAQPECKWKAISETWPKTAEIDQGSEGQV